MVTRALLFGFMLLGMGGTGRADESREIAAGDWSQPVVDSRNYALRGRLVVCEKRVSEERRNVAVYVELQDVTESIGQSMLLYCDMSRKDFRPENKSGLNCEMRNKDGDPVKSTLFPFGGAVPLSQWVTLPVDATIRVRASPFSISRPNAIAVAPHLGSLWIIEDGDPDEYFLTGTFTIAPPDDDVPPGDGHVWKGSIELPRVRLVGRKKLAP